MSTVLAPHRTDFYSTPEWRDVRDRVLERDGHVCTVARLLGGECHDELHVHHIRSREDWPELALDEDNLSTVCKTHHPTWERLRRILTGEAKIPACRHKHPYRIGAVQCLNERRRQVGLPPVEYKPLVSSL